MSKIIIAPFSTRLFNGNPNPKNPPVGFWLQVVFKLNALGHEVIQLGGVGEDRIEGVIQHYVNWPLAALKFVIQDADTWIAVDTWLQHFVWAEKLNKRGVVVWSQSDPLIWGHPENINLLKSRDYLRPLQYQSWPEAIYNADAFVSPDEVVNACQTILESVRSADRAIAVSASV